MMVHFLDAVRAATLAGLGMEAKVREAARALVSERYSTGIAALHRRMNRPASQRTHRLTLADHRRLNDAERKRERKREKRLRDRVHP